MIFYFRHIIQKCTGETKIGSLIKNKPFLKHFT